MPRPRRERPFTALDASLLLALEHEGNLVAAAQRIGIGRDRAVYRVERLQGALGRALVRTRRGGKEPGRTELTAFGRSLLRRVRPAGELRAAPRPGPLEATILEGTWRPRPVPTVRADDGTELVVGFGARPGARVTVAIDPEMILVARRRFPTSARNVLAGRVERIEAPDALRRRLLVRVGGLRLAVGLTPAAVRSLAIREGSRVVLYLKAIAVRRL